MEPSNFYINLDVKDETGKIHTCIIRFNDEMNGVGFINNGTPDDVFKYAFKTIKTLCKFFIGDE